MVFKLYRSEDDNRVYPSYSGTTLVISSFSDDIKYGVNTVPVGGMEETDNYDSGAYVFSLGGRTIKYIFVLDVVTDRNLYEEYQDFRNFFSDYTVGSYVKIQCDELGWDYNNRREAVVESHRTRIDGGSRNYMKITITFYVGEVI